MEDRKALKEWFFTRWLGNTWFIQRKNVSGFFIVFTRKLKASARELMSSRGTRKEKCTG